MTRLSAAERRTAIVTATLEVMVAKGMAAATVRDVAERMGTSSGLIHHYFGSMDELLAAAFDLAARQDLEETRAAVAAERDAVAGLATFFDTYARAEQDWAFQLWLDAWAEAARHPAIQATSRRLNVAWQQLLAALIRRGLAERSVSCADPDAAAWRILSLLDGLALQTVAHADVVSRANVVAWSIAHAEGELGLSPGTLTARDAAHR